MRLLLYWAALVMLGLVCGTASAETKLAPSWSPEPQLGEALTSPVLPSALVSPSQTDASLVQTNFTVNISRREESRNFFRTVYRASDNIPMGWTGNYASCNPGTNSTAYAEATLRRINYFRAMAGVAGNITFNTEYSREAQQAALMMSQNGALSHDPTNTWTCFTQEGHDAAANSNISLGNDYAGPNAVFGCMRDHGANNTAAGHRRWLLYPQTREMGAGSVPDQGTNLSANATWVIDSQYGKARPATREEFVSWPPPGYVAYQVTFPRWSFSYTNANFSSATVTMRQGTNSVPVRLESLAANIGENTLVWVPNGLDANSFNTSWPQPTNDTPYTVTISNVVIGGNARSFSYTVTVMDPDTPGPDTIIPAITGPDTVAVNQTNAYSFLAVSNATGYQWQSSRAIPFSLADGAEYGLTNFTTNTSAGYNVIDASVKAEGAASFHLAHTSNVPQILTLNRAIMPATNGLVSFQSRQGYSTTDEFARLQIAVGGGVWSDLYSQAGTSGAGETSFTNRSFSLAAYAGQSVQLRWNYDTARRSYYNQTYAGVGWYIDSITITNTEEIVGAVTNDLAAVNNLNWVPSQTGNSLLMVRAQVYGGYYLDWGPVKRVVVTPEPPEMRFLPVSLRMSNGQFVCEFDVSHYRSNLVFQLERKPLINSSWESEPAAVFQTITTTQRYRVLVPLGSKQRYYRVKGN